MSQLNTLIIEALEDIKAVDITVLDVRTLTSVTDFMIICSGTSTRHLKAIADRVLERLDTAHINAHGVEGEQGAEWILIDYLDAVVHIMLPKTREFYSIEKLWMTAETARKAHEN